VCTATPLHLDYVLRHVRDSGVWEGQVVQLARSVTAFTGNDARVVDYTAGDLLSAAEAGKPSLRTVAEQGLAVARSRAWLTKTAGESPFLSPPVSRVGFG
jgi:hypothetical protein